MKITIELDTDIRENGDITVKARASVAGSVACGRVRHNLTAYELARSYDRKKLIDDTEARVVAAALSAVKAKA